MSYLYEKIDNCLINLNQDYVFLGAAQTHFEKRVENLKKLLDLKAKGEDIEIEIFTLICCFIDALANIFYDSKTGVRFRKLLYDYGETSVCAYNRISLIQVLNLFMDDNLKSREKNSIYRFEAIREKYESYVKSKVENIDYSSISDAYKKDPSKSELLSELLQIDNANEGLIKDLLERATYASVLYDEYRRPVVHESILKNHWNITCGDHPFYMGVIGGKPGHLTFPERFLVKMLEEMLSRIMGDIPVQP